MTMVRLPRRLAPRTAQVAGLLARVMLVVLAVSGRVSAQGPPVHFQHAGVMPPGAIGNLRLRQGGPLSGYFQPVEITAPQGALISLASQGQFTAPQPCPRRVGMLIGAVYRLQVTQIPGQAGMEVYPTIEIIDRTYPPPGQGWRFPIPIELTTEELTLAIGGRQVTRVIYLEDPDRALPVAQRLGDQNWFEAAEGENPLEVADRLGRPVAILRMGARIPGPNGPDARFLYGSPPVWAGPAGGAEQVPTNGDAKTDAGEASPAMP